VPAVSASVQRHREKVLAQAEHQLRSIGKLNSGELIQLYKKFLKTENYRLHLRHKAGESGREVCSQRASLMDVILRHLLDAALQGDPTFASKPARFAVVASGGYGRGELNPYSDIDVLFLVEEGRGGLDPRVAKVIEQILYMLWDIGFKVGHATRSVANAVEHANADMQTKTAYLESRLVAGDAALFESFRQQFIKRCVDGHVEEYVHDRLQNQTERHEKYGRTVTMQEPNVKNGCGSLRDYQNLLWIAFFKERVQTTAGLVEKKLLNEKERRSLDAAYDFLLRVRTELHYLNKRSTDVIVLGQQLVLANRLRYPQKNVLRRSEAFMRDYYQHARNIYHITELLSDRLSLAPVSAKAEEGKRGGLFGLFAKASSPRIEHFDGFYSADGRVYPESRDLFNQDPGRMMRLFQHLQQRKLRLSPELELLVRRRLHLVDRTFQYSKSIRETFRAICSRKGEVGAILRAMHRVDFLGRYIPEFGQLTCLVQHEFFHRYTADEHTLVCIEKLDQLIDTQDPKLQDYREIFQKLEDPLVLYLALLLHDTGKASNARSHAEASALFAQKVARRLQLTSEQRRTLLLLVDEHILLSTIAQRRNLDDPATIAGFAARVKSQATLDALMLLTLADGQGTGDENWSDWKETLVWQLYRQTKFYLADGEAFYRQRVIERADLQEAVRKKLPSSYHDEVEVHFENMPERYFQTYGVADVVEHVRLFRKFLATRYTLDEASLAPAVKWIAHPNAGHSEVHFCGWNREELLARIAGAFSCVQLNILSADIFTRRDDLVLDIFRVCDRNHEAVTDERDMTAVERRLQQALATEDFHYSSDLAKAMKRRGFHLSQELDFPTRITIENDAHPVYTMVEILSPDRLGLLYRILRAFGKVGVQIASSRIATDKGAAADSFYVSDAAGKKLSDALSQRLNAALWEATQTQIQASAA
jgi:[protein-PII] uridylyltransferase